MVIVHLIASMRHPNTTRRASVACSRGFRVPQSGGMFDTAYAINLIVVYAKVRERHCGASTIAIHKLDCSKRWTVEYLDNFTRYVLWNYI